MVLNMSGADHRMVRCGSESLEQRLGHVRSKKTDQHRDVASFRYDSCRPSENVAS